MSQSDQISNDEVSQNSITEYKFSPEFLLLQYDFLSQPNIKK